VVAGRVLVIGGGKRISASTFLKLERNAAHLVVMEDSGPKLAEVNLEDPRQAASVVFIADDLKPAIPALDLLVRAWRPWPAPAGADAQGRRQATDPAGRAYTWGGDPVLPRRLDDGLWSVWLEDYRIIDGRLRPVAIRLLGPLGLTAVWELDQSLSPVATEP
jgi:hypothetical protein